MKRRHTKAELKQAAADYISLLKQSYPTIDAEAFLESFEGGDVVIEIGLPRDIPEDEEMAFREYDAHLFGEILDSTGVAIVTLRHMKEAVRNG